MNGAARPPGELLGVLELHRLVVVEGPRQQLVPKLRKYPRQLEAHRAVWEQAPLDAMSQVQSLQQGQAMGLTSD